MTIGVVFAACGGDDGPTAPVEQVASVEVTPESSTAEALDATVQFEAEALDASGSTVSDVDFTWSSSDEAVAQVDDTGLVTATGNGTAEITATAGDASGSGGVTVQQVLSSIEVTPGPVTITGVDATQAFSAEGLDANDNPLATQPSFDWSSSDTNVATVDGSGEATAVARGSAEISAAAEGLTGTADVTVEGILHWTDSNSGTNVVPGALDSLGVTATTAADSTEFVSLLQEGGWGIVVFGEQGDEQFNGSVQTEVESYVTNGGKLLATTFADGNLLVLMEATRTDTNYSDLETGDHEIFADLPASIAVTDPGWITYAGAYTADGEAECLGSTSAGDCGAILGNGDQTLLLGPLFDAYSTPTEGETLVAQSMEFLIDVSASSSASTSVRSVPLRSTGGVGGNSTNVADQ
jgi:hypothetical protein